MSMKQLAHCAIVGLNVIVVKTVLVLVVVGVRMVTIVWKVHIKVQ